MTPIQEDYQASKEWQELTLKAYPPPVKFVKEKKVKNRGTRFPGGQVDDAAKKVEGLSVKDEATPSQPDIQA